jgi:aryl-alcohol dehydrogenase-like predicted oxidoreductase
MQYRPLGKTGIQISALAFGAGPVSTLMVGEDCDRQRAVVSRALGAGINWFDTAATYGNGQSERSLGRQLAELSAASRVHVATKVRFMPTDLDDFRRVARQSFMESLHRLQLSRVTLLQLHNSITRRRGDEPTSITPEDVLGPNGVLAAFRELQKEGLVDHLGLTGIGNPGSLREVVRSGNFATMQVPYHLLNPSAGQVMDESFDETNYGNIIQDCGEMGMGVLAIRVLAGGALAGNEPSPHTLKTPFFPLALYERDRARAEQLRVAIGPNRELPKEAIRFVLAHPHISAALIGFGEPSQIDEALAAIV